MPNQNEYRLVDYLDNHLSEQEASEVAMLIETDKEVRQQWEYLKVAVQAVEYTALQDKVSQVKEQYKVLQNGASAATSSRVKRIYKWVAVAAIFVVVVPLAAKYATTGADDLYMQGYRAYSLNTSRSGNTMNEMEMAYRSKNWQAVIDAFNRVTTKDNKTLFLSAMAHMELKQYEEAARQLEQVRVQNANSGSDYFQDEAEYYLALNWLALNRTREAITLIEKIRTNEKHLYHEQAGRIADIDLKIVSYKAGK